MVPESPRRDSGNPTIAPHSAYPYPFFRSDGYRYAQPILQALPIVETMEGEIAAYIPTNLISITDGQLYFDADLFAGGFLPAIKAATQPQQGAEEK